MRPLRFGIVGCGGIARVHGEVLETLREEGLAEVVAATDVSPGRAERFCAQFGGTPEDSFASLLKRPDVDAVTICTPSGIHGEMATQAARAGKHILSEKPLDIWLDAVDEAMEATTKAGVVYGGIFQERFSPDAQKLKRAVESGAFGKLILVCAETKWYRDQGYYDASSWRGTWRLDGGVFSNQGIHSLDKVQWLAGEVVEVLSARLELGRERTIEAETTGVATVRFASGALGTLAMTTLAYDGFPERLDISGTEGSAVLLGDRLTHFVTKATPPEDASEAGESDREKSKDPLALGIDGHLANVRDFALAVREGREPLVSAREARRAVKLLNLIYQAAGVGPYINKGWFTS